MKLLQASGFAGFESNWIARNRLAPLVAALVFSLNAYWAIAAPSAPLGAVLAPAQLQERPRLVFNDGENGISCDSYDVALGVPWPKGGPIWVDSAGQTRGDRAFALERVRPDDRRSLRKFDLTSLVGTWGQGSAPSDGVLLRLREGEDQHFHSRHVADIALRPQLILTLADGRRRFIEASASAALDCSTYRGQVRNPVMVAKRMGWIALRFELPDLQQEGGARLSKAELLLVRAQDRQQGPFLLEAFRLATPSGPTVVAPSPGIAARYPADQGIGADAEVFFADNFESKVPNARWDLGATTTAVLTGRDDKRSFQPLGDRALRVHIPRGAQLGLDWRYRFKKHHGVEPEEAYFRYYLWLAPDWLRASDGGKLPGFAGTYGRAAWGGRPWDGVLGWSMRGSYGIARSSAQPSTANVILGTYAYHSKSSLYGEGLGWIGSNFGGLISPGQWVCIEQRVKLNTPGKEDGLLQTWVDGRQVLFRQDLRLRDTSSIRIEEVWMNFFHGGTAAAPVDMHAYVDNLVIARQYIGLMSK